MDELSLAAFFTIDSSAATAYSGCTADTYQLVEADGTTPNTDTTYVSYAKGTGLSWIIGNLATDIDIYLKMTTKGGISKVKQFKFSVFTCGSETIAPNSDFAHVEAIYATGTAGDTYTITAV